MGDARGNLVDGSLLTIALHVKYRHVTKHVLDMSDQAMWIVIEGDIDALVQPKEAAPTW